MKKQTLEEFINSQPYYGHGTPEYLEGIKVGAKWQQEQAKEMEKEQKGYSEEEVKHIISEALQSALVTVDLEQWFNQFKQQEQ
jgi:hypothetical protein